MDQHAGSEQCSCCDGVIEFVRNFTESTAVAVVQQCLASYVSAKHTDLLIHNCEVSSDYEQKDSSS